ncbi:oxysterol-binding protein-related protein 3-like isoform X2 [Paramacrobiotus metropolitanus]|uniref:oxysterol-binding protein-related protein 3-like isoform X2 n=1 Tax=Paramacrobiotus metropolitanus TaxID=2943436 RepID=UPI0024459F39|nr:oxysterol-binding protein-related protein 3-like isoform X2 [Paramacrobiotus metropolitanus]
MDHTASADTVKLLRTVSDPKDKTSILRGSTMPRPNSIAVDLTNRVNQQQSSPVGSKNGTARKQGHCHSPSSVSMSSSTPSGEGSSSQSEYFSYEAEESGGSIKPSPVGLFDDSRANQTVGTDYEIIKGLRVGETFEKVVPVFEGLLSKKRRRRGTGFQKRFCRLEEGYLIYAKNRGEMEKGNYLGKLDIALSFVVLNKKKRGIEIDATEAVHHFRAYSDAQFAKWREMLYDHRLYRQATMASLLGDADAEGTLKDATLLNQPSAAGCRIGLDVSKAQLDAVFKKLDRAAALVEQWEMAANEPITERDIQNSVNDTGSKRGTIKKFFSRRKKPDKKEDLMASSGSSSKGSTVPRPPTMETLQLPSSNASASFPDNIPAIPSSPIPSLGGHLSDISHGSQSSLTKYNESQPNNATTSRMDVDSLLLARELISTFRVIGNDFRQLYNRFNGALSDDGTLTGSMVQTRIVHTLSSDSAGTIGSGDTFFTAISHFSSSRMQHSAHLMSDTSSDRSHSRDEGCSSDSDVDDIDNENFNRGDIQRQTGRRTVLPSQRPPADGSLLKMIGGFIGKDLTRLALPVKVNEPLSMLQRLAEELEYCELLDRAADCADPVERMTLVATFAVSGFASTFYRASTKPFNPILGETYECVREDKGFRYVAEQVSHHPPISACHAESLSDKYCYWQDFRPKTRFWGRSIEVTNHGEVHVNINKSEHYRWNKPSSRVAVSALMSQKGHVEVYGTIKITCSNDYYANLTFGKSSSEGTPTHVEGTVYGPDRAPVTAIFGSWNECVYWTDPGRTGTSRSAGTKVLWRAGAMPADHDVYYGFTRFAIELNEISDEMTRFLPCTDSRLRPDQRLLECGNLASAEIEKKRVEQAQRERNAKYTKDHYPYEPRWFRRVEQTSGNDIPDIYEFTYRYWTLRESPGFMRVVPAIEAIW